MVWDWPLRIWHWALAGALITSLYTGLADDLDLMDAHLLSGQLVVVLLLFRLGWFVWGGLHARLPVYLKAAPALWTQLRGANLPAAAAHTPAGAGLALLLWTSTAIQAGSGLFSSDDIFTEGPLARAVSGDAVDLATATHHRVFWIIIALAAGHVIAIAWYGIWRRNPLALGMFTGRKPGPAADQGRRVVAGLATLAGAAALYYLMLAVF
jgi:cytochrome b